MRLLNPELNGGGEPPAPRASSPRWNPEFDEMKVPLTVEWQGLKMSAGEVSRLKPGDILNIELTAAQFAESLFPRARSRLLKHGVPRGIGQPLH